MAAAFMTGWTAYRAVMTNNYFVKSLIFLGYVFLLGGAIILKFPEIVNRLTDGLNAVSMQTTPNSESNDNLLFAKTIFITMLAVLFGSLVYFAESVVGHAIKKIDLLYKEIANYSQVIAEMHVLLKTWDAYQNAVINKAEVTAYRSSLKNNKDWLKNIVYRELAYASTAKIKALEANKPSAKSPLYSTATDIGSNATNNTDFDKKIKESNKAIADIDVIVNQTIH
jgi:hypothetical protein